MKQTDPVISQVCKIFKVNKLNTLVYSDTITEKNAPSFLTNAEKKINNEIHDATLSRKLFKVIIECVININIHYKRSNKSNYSLLVAGFDNRKNIFVLAGNKVKNEEAEFLRTKINELNQMTTLQLKLRFHDILKNTPLYKINESAIWLVDIARKKSGDLRYFFLRIDNEHTFFALKIQIKKHTEKLPFSENE